MKRRNFKSHETKSKGSRFGVGSLSWLGFRRPQGDCGVPRHFFWRTSSKGSHFKPSKTIAVPTNYIPNQEQFLSFKKGEEKGFAHYFREHYKPLQFFCQKLLKNEPLAEDIATNTFVKLFERREAIRNESNLVGFLYTTARNACIDQLLQQKSRARNHKQLQYLAAVSERTTFEEIVHAETWTKVLKAMETLPPATKKVFQMLFIEGKNYSEIAKETGRSKETIRIQKRKGLIILKRKLLLSVIVFCLNCLSVLS